MYDAASAENTTFLVQFGKLCSIVGQLPASAILSKELTKDGDVAVAPGGLMDTWRGDCQGVKVAIKAFRASTTQNLEEKQVRVE